jgi:hypothetical protein
MKASAIAVRISVAIVTVVVALLCSTPAHAQQFTFSFQMGGNTYTPVAFSWGPAGSSAGQGVSDELTFTLAPSFEGNVDFMNEAQSKQIFATADLQDLFTFGPPTPVAVVDIQMTNVRVVSVRIAANNDASVSPGAPQEIVTVKFDSVVYTFQPYLPNGQRNGPPSTFTANFKK